MQKIERIRSDNCLREWGSCLNRDVSRNCRVSSQKERERESSGIGRVTSCVMLIAGWDVRERRRRKWDARSRRWAVTRERVWWPASQQQQPRCSVAHAHLNYISSGETLRKETRVRRPEGKQREREREREKGCVTLLYYSFHGHQVATKAAPHLLLYLLLCCCCYPLVSGN